MQVIKCMIFGGVDYVFECVGDIGIVIIVLQLCCDVSFLIFVQCFLRRSFICFILYFKVFIVWFYQGWGLIVIFGVLKVKFEVIVYYGLFFIGRILKGFFFGGWKFKLDFFKLVDMYVKKVRVKFYVRFVFNKFSLLVFWSY